MNERGFGFAKAGPTKTQGYQPWVLVGPAKTQDVFYICELLRTSIISWAE